MDIKERAAYKIGHPIESPEQAPYRVQTRVMNAAWKERLDAKLAHICSENPDGHYKELADRLLSFGGEHVCFPCIEEDMDKILSRGQLWMGDKVDLKKGEPCHCHSNSAYLWDANRDKTTIATGYALTEDGLWRQHSWVIHLKPRQNRVVETTTKRLIYFGFAMTEEECEEFLYNNN